MLSKDPLKPSAESQISPSSSANINTPGASAAVMNPRDTVEVASAGTTPVNDPAAKDTQPPGFEDLDHFV
jgi:hypothetical protein